MTVHWLMVAISTLAALLCGMRAFDLWRLKAAETWVGPTAILLSGLSFWSGGYALQLGFTDPFWSQGFAFVRHLGMATVPVTLLAVAMAHLGRPLALRTLASLGIVPAATLLLVATNDQHGWIWLEGLPGVGHDDGILARRFGFWQWLYVGYCYALVAFSGLLLLRSRSPRPRSSFAVPVAIGGVSLGMAANVIYLFWPDSLVHYDLTPAIFVLMGALLSVDLMGRRAVSRVSEVVAAFSEPALTITSSGRIRGWNPAADELFGPAAKDMTGTLLVRFFPDLSDWSGVVFERSWNVETKWTRGSLRLRLQLRYTPLKGGFGVFVGGVLMIRDLTALFSTQEMIKYQSRFEQVIARISTDFIGLEAQELMPAIDRALGLLGGFLGADRCGLFLSKCPDGGTGAVPEFSTTHQWYTEGTESFPAEIQAGSEQSPWWLVRLASNEIVHVPDVSQLPPVMREGILSVDAKSIIAVPIISQNRLRGYIAFQWVRAVASWRQDTSVMLKFLGDLFANVLERRDSELALRESEHRFRLLAENSTDLILRLDEAGRCLYASPASDGLLGIAPEVLPGLWGEDLFHPEDLAAMGGLGSVFPASPENFTRVFRLRHRAEHYLWIESTSHAVQEGETGQALEIQASLRNVSDRKASELALQDSETFLRQVIDTNPHQIYVMDAQGRYLLANEAKAAFHGRRADDLLGKSPEDLLDDQGLSGQVAREDIEIMLSGVPGNSEEFALTHPVTGESSWLDAVISPLLDAEGVPKGVLAVATDVTERKIADARIRRAKLDLEEAYDATIAGWARALELRDRETQGHSARVTALTLLLARSVGIPEEELVHVRRGALLHDMGKLAVPDSILLKPGPLSGEEWEVMRQHPGNAYRWLAPITFLRPALGIPYAHHERWDGSGYPRGLKGEAIPLAARIFAVVDVWDALTSDRPYREALSPRVARNYVRERAGIEFDPAVAEAFLEMIARHEARRQDAEPSERVGSNRIAAGSNPG